MGRVRRPKNSVFRNIIEQQYDESVKYKLYRSVKGSKDWVQRLGLLRNLPVHNGCVNCICWNEKGDRLLSGSDDQHLVVSNPYNYKVLTNYRSSHKANIFSAKFLPCTNDTGIVSCSGDGMILYSDLLRLNETHNNVFNCHVGTTYEVATIPNDPYTFLSCGEDCTVRCFDLRTKEKCIKARCTEVCNSDVIISCQRAVTALTVNSAFSYQLAIGCSDSTVRIYDRRMLGGSGGDNAKPLMTYIAPGMEGRSFRITSLSFSPRGEDILVSYSSEHLYLFGIQHGETMTLETESLVEEPMCVDADSPIAPVRRLRLRGDWSDTGPDARPQNYLLPGGGGASQARPTLHGTLMQRMTDVLSRMLNDPATRAALSHGGEAFPESDQSSHSEPPAHAGSEGDEGEEDVATGEVIEEVSNPHPLDLPLPSFSSSFSQPQQEVQVETMEIEEHVVASREDEAQQEENKDETPSPSTSSAPVEKASTSNAQDSNISHLNELSTMYHGFVEKHGVEPMVNLMYSDVGSTASCISVFVGKEMSRQTPEEQCKTPEEQQQAEAAPPPSAEPPPVNESTSGDNNFNSSQEDDPSLPRIHSVRGNVSFSDSDDDLSPVLAAECRLVHPIEKHMDDAIKNARNEGAEEKDEPTKTRKSYFKQKYIGHRNARTMIKEATFWGDDYVISGSDCGHVFMWERQEGRLEMLLQADQHVVNCVQPHPYLPLLATSGIDYDVKLWAPTHSEPTFDQEMAEELMKRNAVMLEETKDTITVPASFMIRMLACLNQIRRGGRGRQQRRESNTNSD